MGFVGVKKWDEQLLSDDVHNVLVFLFRANCSIENSMCRILWSYRMYLNDQVDCADYKIKRRNVNSWRLVARVRNWYKGCDC